MSETGYVKYRCDHVMAAAAVFPGFELLNQVRSLLFQEGLIGMYSNGIGFGNVSLRASGSRSFYISGTMTGGNAVLAPEHYTQVVACEFDKNWLKCEGPIQASSESMTHAAIYEQDSTVCAALHVHHLELWKRVLNCIPTTRKEVEYGTPEMAAEVARLFQETDVSRQGIFAMAGHEEGLFAFGASPERAYRVLMDTLHSALG